MASVESHSEHPLGKAIVASFRDSQHRELAAVEHFQLLPGRGVKGFVHGKEVLAGNLEMMAEEAIPVCSADLAKVTPYLNLSLIHI